METIARKSISRFGPVIFPGWLLLHDLSFGLTLTSLVPTFRNVIGTSCAQQVSMELLIFLVLIPAALGLALVLQVGALKVILWALQSGV